MALISTRDLTVRYGAIEALSRLSLTMEAGVVGLLGPNGAGKSTLLKTLLGFVRPAEGAAEVLGTAVERDPLGLRLKTGYMPERNAFLPELNAVEMVALAGELGGLPRPTALGRAHETLRFAGLAEERYRPVESYSTGMLQRVKLAAALVHDPELLLLDEPTSGLDPTGRREMLELIQDLGRGKGISIVLSTHLLHDVEAVCDSVALLHRGRLAIEGRLALLKKASDTEYLLRVREPSPGKFAAALATHGLEADQKEDGAIQVRGFGGEARLFFELAQSVGGEIRQLRRSEPSLEELILSALKGAGEHAAP
jgi:ABC-2 type transport system ATP-binding protein